jgi:hypothetical protein
VNAVDGPESRVILPCCAGIARVPFPALEAGATASHSRGHLGPNNLLRVHGAFILPRAGFRIDTLMGALGTRSSFVVAGSRTSAKFGAFAVRVGRGHVVSTIIFQNVWPPRWTRNGRCGDCDLGISTHPLS